MSPEIQNNEIDWREVGVLVGTVAVVVLLWDTPVVYPLRILVVFFHELSHGLAAVATGGRIVEIQIVPEEGGLCITAGGNSFLTLSAGYLGSLIWGGALLVAVARTRSDQVLTGALAFILLLVTGIWVRPILSFGFAFGTVSGLALLLFAGYAPQWANAFLLKVIGVTSCLYAVLDIKSDILDRPHLQSDATLLADITWIPAWAWGTIWLLVSAVAGYKLVSMACRKGRRASRQSPRSSEMPRS